MDDVPGTLSASLAQKLQKRASSVGYDFPSADSVLPSLASELRELAEAREIHAQEEIENELGDVLFTVVNLSRHLKVDAEAALRKANRRFEQRVRRAECAAHEAGSRLEDESVEQLEGDGLRPKRKRVTTTCKRSTLCVFSRSSVAMLSNNSK